MVASSSNTITMQQMLARLDAGELVSLKVVRYDEQKRTGGSILEILQCKLAAASDGTPRQRKAGFGESLSKDEAPDPLPDGVRERLADLDEPIRKNPNHFKNFTRNLILYSAGTKTGRFVKIHPALVLEFCGKTVI